VNFSVLTLDEGRSLRAFGVQRLPELGLEISSGRFQPLSFCGGWHRRLSLW